MKKIILIIVISLTTNLANAQLSFLLKKHQKATIFLKNETKKEGYIKFLNNNKISFKEKKNGKASILNHNTVDKITTRINYKKCTFKYITIENNQKPSLLEIIGEGKVILYEKSYSTHNLPILTNNSFNTNNTQSLTHYTEVFVSRPNDSIATDLDYKKFNRKHFFKKIIEYFKDCPSLIKKIKAKEYKRRDFIEIVDYYNDNCDSNEASQIN